MISISLGFVFYFPLCTRATDIFVKVVDAMEEDSASIKQVPCR